MNPEITYQHTSDFLEISRSLKMKSREWKILFAIDGKRSMKEIAAQFSMDETRLQAILARFVSYGLICECDIGLDEFVQRYEAEMLEDSYSRRVLKAYLSDEQHGFQLGRVIEFIEENAESEDTRNFNVYRVFLKISPALLREAGIDSLKEIKADITIKSPELKQSLRDAIYHTLGREIPNSLFKV